jgi:hypothetical protein
MSGSQKKDILFTIYSSNRNVFTLKDVAMLSYEADFNSLNRKLNYYVRTGKLVRPRKGIYAKAGYSPEELAGILYTPSYISLEYVLQKAGIIFQFDGRITSVSYLSRSVEIDNRTFSYRKMKGDLLVASEGIIQVGNVNIASPERAFLDMLYLNSRYYFDNLNPLNKELTYKMLRLYGSKTLTARIQKIL